MCDFWPTIGIWPPADIPGPRCKYIFASALLWLALHRSLNRIFNGEYLANTPCFGRILAEYWVTSRKENCPGAFYELVWGCQWCDQQESSELLQNNSRKSSFLAARDMFWWDARKWSRSLLVEWVGGGTKVLGDRIKIERLGDLQCERVSSFPHDRAHALPPLGNVETRMNGRLGNKAWFVEVKHRRPVCLVTCTVDRRQMSLSIMNLFNSNQSITNTNTLIFFPQRLVRRGSQELTR